jgi:hypothetical protein
MPSQKESLTTLTTKTSLKEYFQMGTELANKHGLGPMVVQRFREAARRSVRLVILKPHPRMVREHPGWLKAYAEGKLVPGAVEEEIFCVALNPTTNQVYMSDDDPRQKKHSTVTFLLEEHTAYMVAMRSESVFSAWLKGYPVRIHGEYAVRDVELVDEILNTYYQLMMENGHDLAALFRGVR